MNQIPSRLALSGTMYSLADGITPIQVVEEIDGIDTIVAESDDLTKNILNSDRTQNTATELESALKQVRNKIKYTYRDIADCGLSSIYAYFGLTENGNEFVYDPTKTNLLDVPLSYYIGWKEIASIFTKYCEKTFKLAMSHLDGPRKLVLNGNLSTVDDMRKDPDDVFKK